VSDPSSPRWIVCRNYSHPCDVAVKIRINHFTHFSEISITKILTIFGLKGGCTSRFSIFSQSIRRKNAWLRTSSSPRIPHPSLLLGFFVRNCNKRILCIRRKFFNQLKILSYIHTFKYYSSEIFIVIHQFLELLTKIYILREYFIWLSQKRL